MIRFDTPACLNSYRESDLRQSLKLSFGPLYRKFLPSRLLSSSSRTLRLRPLLFQRLPRTSLFFSLVMPAVAFRPLSSRILTHPQIHEESSPAARLQTLWQQKKLFGEFILRLHSTALNKFPASKPTCSSVIIRPSSVKGKVEIPASVSGKRVVESGRWSRRIDYLISKLTEMPRDVTDEVFIDTLERVSAVRVLAAGNCGITVSVLAEWAFKQEWFETCARDFSRQMDRYGKARRFSEMEATFHQMQESGFPPDQVSYTILISSWGRVGEMEKALDYFNEMKAHGIMPDVMTYSSAMSAYGEGGLPGKAEELLKEMEGAGIQSSIASYTIVITAYGRKGKPLEAQRVFGEMQSRAKLIPDTKAYTALMGAHVSAGNLEKSLDLFQNMKRLGVPVDDLARARLVEACGKAGRCEEAVKLVLEGEVEGRRAGANTYAALISAFGVNGFLEEAQEVFDEMVASKQPIVGKVFVALFVAYASAGREETAMDIKEKMVKAGWEPTWRQMDEMINALLLGGLENAASSLTKLRDRSDQVVNSEGVEQLKKPKVSSGISSSPSRSPNEVLTGVDSVLSVRTVE